MRGVGGSLAGSSIRESRGFQKSIHLEDVMGPSNCLCNKDSRG